MKCEDLRPLPFEAHGLQSRLPILGVGWLSNDGPLAKGPVAVEVFERLAEMLLNAWQPYAVGGSHSCSFCLFTGGPKAIRHRDRSIELGSNNLILPAGSAVIVAPSLILHYVDSHQYCPPSSFVMALMECPKMRSVEYFRALKAAGLTTLKPAAGVALDFGRSATGCDP